MLFFGATEKKRNAVIQERHNRRNNHPCPINFLLMGKGKVYNQGCFRLVLRNETAQSAADYRARQIRCLHFNRKYLIANANYKINFRFIASPPVMDTEWFIKASQ